MKLTESDTTSKGYCKHHFITLEHVEEAPTQLNKLGEVVKARQGYTIQRCFRCGKTLVSHWPDKDNGCQDPSPCLQKLELPDRLLTRLGVKPPRRTVPRTIMES